MEEDHSTTIDSRLASINIEEEMKNSYIDYSMSVIVGRSLPDARDGFKPVHRRVLYAMHRMDNVFNRPYKKSATVVGEVMGKYHPHGDTSIYDTLVRLAQDFSLRYPLVDGHGNFGSIDGDPPAAMRYTECRMQKIAATMLDDLDKDTVDFIPNYNGEEREPRVLPAKLPNLLLNGSSGIAVGMATNIPPHNLRELCDGLIHFIDEPNCTIDDLMQFVKGPDFPTGATICGLGGIESMYKGTRGSIVMRGKADIIENNNRTAILITEIPYGVNKAAMIENMAHLVNDKVLEGISDIRDESSDKDGIRVLVELKNNAKPAPVILNKLYKHTALQTTFGANMLALDHGRPRRMTLKDFFQCYVDHRFEVVTRRSKFELKKAQDRRHILDGLLIAQSNMDQIVKIIKDSPNREEAKKGLVAAFGFSEPQVEAILNMRLYQLTGLERGRLEAELAELLLKIEYLEGLLADPAKIFGVLKDDLTTIKDTFTQPGDRRSEIVPMRGDVNLEDLIADEPCVVTLSHRGYVKRVPLNTYKEQKRGGKGVKGLNIKMEDFIEKMFVPMAHDTLLFFTNTGRVYAERAFTIEEGSRTGFGKPVINVLEGLQKDESIVEILPIRNFEDDEDIIFVMANGMVKRTALNLYGNIRKTGIIAVNLEEGNSILQVLRSKPEDEILIATRKGKIAHFSTSEIRRVGRTAVGVRGIKLAEAGDSVCGAAIRQPDTTLLLACENGYGKRTDFDDFRKTSRGCQGVKGIVVNERNGDLMSIHPVKDDETMIMLTTNGMLVRSPVDGVNIIGRSTQGVCFIKMAEGNKLVSLSIAPHDDDDDEDTPPTLDADGNPIAQDQPLSESTTDAAPEANAPEATDVTDSLDNE